MGAKIEIKCDRCGRSNFKEMKEVKRRLKNNPNAKFYCDSICSGLAQDKKASYEEKECPVCKNKFTCKTSNKRTDRTFCSRSCASAGSVTEARREASRIVGCNNELMHNVFVTAAALRSRENWKYEKLIEELNKININYQFEYVVENSIYDLALIDKKILIEFDGPYHQWLESDKQKTELASHFGWNLIRIQTEANKVILFEKIAALVTDNYNAPLTESAF